MPIPDYETIMLPLLKFAIDGKEYSSKEAVHHLAKDFKLTDEEKKQLYPTKKVSIFYDRTHWALTYLKHANLLESTKRGFFRITERGRDVLKQQPNRIDDKFLSQFSEFLVFQTPDKKRNKKSKANLLNNSVNNDKTPYETLEESHKVVREELANDLLNSVKNCSPNFFERLVVELLVSMGYGGSIKEAGQAIGRTGDEGIDGIIKEDVLGLDLIYIQAKKWDGMIGRPEIQKFVGALHGQRARKGIFITTGLFSNTSKDYSSAISDKIVLIDGKQLTEYMIDNDIGVTLEKSYLLKKLDKDYFEEV